MTMRASLQPVADVSVGDWLGQRLGGPLGSVGSVVPHGFAAYARVLHPVDPADGTPPTTWARVCADTGAIPHPVMQWGAIAAPGAEARPDLGDLAPAALEALLGVLAPVTGSQDCFHALWEGWGWVHGRGVAVFGSDVRPEPGVTPDVWALPRLHHPDRDYLLFRGPLRAALDMGWQESALGFEPQSPSLFWPADRSWCVGTEIDFDSTLVAGPAGLVAAVLDAPGLEAWPVNPADSLRADADLLNSG